jgi:hypothetical protein
MRSVVIIRACLSAVMAGPVPAIHVLLEALKKDVDARDGRGHERGTVLP